MKARAPRLAVPAPIAVVLAAIGAGALVRGIGYIGRSEPPAQLTPLETIAPFWVYSLLWFAAGALALVAIFACRAFNSAIAASAALWALWGISYLLTYFTEGTGRSYLTGAVFLLVALLIFHSGKVARQTGDV